jgi:ethanolamine utilization protein EutQ (cupin superfamily)
MRTPSWEMCNRGIYSIWYNILILLLTLRSEKENPDKPMSCGFYRLEKGTPLVYTYTYDEMKIIVEGKFEIADETGQKVTATPGDVFYFPKGATITFTTEDYGLAFYVGSPCPQLGSR